MDKTLNVYMCSNCPFLYWNYLAHQTIEECWHPDVTDESSTIKVTISHVEIPKNCPLRNEPITVKLYKE